MRSRDFEIKRYSPAGGHVKNRTRRSLSAANASCVWGFEQIDFGLFVLFEAAGLGRTKIAMRCSEREQGRKEQQRAEH